MAQIAVSSHAQARNWVLWGGAAVTLLFWAAEQDPFNLPKSLVLAVAAAWVVGYLATLGREFWSARALPIGIVLGYVFFLVVAFFATDYWYTGLFGDYARRTGLITYLCLAILMLGAMRAFAGGAGLGQLSVVALVVGSVLSVYGLMQHFNLDFVKWNNPYNSILSTLGNPDFASAAMAIFMVLAFGVLADMRRSLVMRSWAAFNVVALLAAIVYSQARQGLLAGLIGVGLVVLVWVYQRNLLVGHGLAGLGLLTLLVGGVGMLDMGPLKSFMYKASVTYRGDYWRAGWRMFIHHPWFGVGLDRYGAYFRQYRDATQSLRRGPAVISNAAHDVPLQLAATGGVFVLVSFLVLTVFIGWRGWVAIRRVTGMQQIVVTSVVGAWVTYQAQSLISIDNVGIAVWGWILGGIVIALSYDGFESSVSAAGNALGLGAKKNSKNPANKVRGVKGVRSGVGAGSGHGSLQPFVSGILATVALAFSVPIFMQDQAMKITQSLAKPTSAQYQAWSALATKPLRYGLEDPHNKVQIGLAVAQAGQVQVGENYMQDVIAADSRDYEAQDMLAAVYEQTGKQKLAVPLRQALNLQDPWNYQNQLSLAQDLAAAGDNASAKAVYNQILSYAASTTEGGKAKTALASLK